MTGSSYFVQFALGKAIGHVSNATIFETCGKSIFRFSQKQFCWVKELDRSGGEGRACFSDFGTLILQIKDLVSGTYHMFSNICNRCVCSETSLYKKRKQNVQSVAT